jgi:hypothetical protein
MRPVVPSLLALALIGAAPSQPFTIAESGQGFAHLEDALMAVRGQDATVLIAPGVYKECAIQQAGHITFKATTPGSVVFDGETCEGKAALVLRGEGSTVDGIVFRNMRVEDGNGAGIRIEIGDLTVVNSMFLDSQEGILGGTDQPSRVRIDRSTFAGLGQCDETPDCAHSVYLANTGSVTISRPRVEIVDNSFDDTAGRKTNYMIDLPEGATGRIAGNVFVQGTRKENWTGMVVVAAEQRKFRSAGLVVEGNTASVAPGQAKSPAFVANASGERLAVGENRLGAGIRAYEAR